MSHTGWSYATSLPWLRIFLIFVTLENLMPSCIIGQHSFARMTGSCVCMSKKQTTLEPNSYYLITYCDGHRAGSQLEVVHCNWAWLCENFSHLIQVCVELRYQDERMSNVISHFLISHSSYPALNTHLCYILDMITCQRIVTRYSFHQLRLSTIP